MQWLDRAVDSFICHIRDDPKRQPPLAVGEPKDDPTYWRWFIIPRNRFVNFYLHHFRHDDVHDLHDHRAHNISFILQGSYYEEQFEMTPLSFSPIPSTYRRFRPRYSLTFRRADTPHRVVLPRDSEGKEISCWSLFIKFPDFRDWGFWCPGNSSARWKRWQDYAATNDPKSPLYGTKGAGCDD